MSNKILIGLDNGNKCTKTSEGYISESGFSRTNDEPISRSNLLVYEGKYFSIGSSRMSVQMDKTVNQDAFVLSLPAIADGIEKAKLGERAEVLLGVGLPIVNYGTLKNKFRDYFIRKDIEFVYNRKEYQIDITDCRVYPQGYAALIPIFNNYKDILCNMVDIGGYTVDIFQIENGIIKPSTSFSLPIGVITLIAKIQQELLKSNIRLTETQVQDIIAGKEPVLFDVDVTKTIKVMAEEHVEQLVSKIEEHGYEFRNPSIFCGGGSMLLNNYIMETNRIKYVDFLDQFANARGYRILLENELYR